MTSKMRAFLGVATTAIFVMLGASMIANGTTWIGGALIALGVFRAYVVVRQLRQS